MSETKKNFLFGLVSGIAVVAVVALIVVLAGGSSMNSNQGNQPTGNNAVGNDNWPTAGNNTGSNSGSEKVDFVISADDHVRGDEDAPVTIVEFSDFQCPYCSGFHSTMKDVMGNYEGQVKWVYRHFPLDSIHSQARSAAEASECAAEQGKFWEYADALFDNQSRLGDSLFNELAADLGLDTQQFSECYSSGKYADKVDQDYREGRSKGVSGTPGNFINGKPYAGALPYEQVEAIIQSML